MNKKLNAKDFILIGVLTALMWIICMIISTVMSIAGPVTNVFYPAVVAIPNGIETTTVSTKAINVRTAVIGSFGPTMEATLI